MAAINIKDLADSIDMDRQAMQAISGGARMRGKQAPLIKQAFGTVRLVDYPPGFDKRKLGAGGNQPK